MLKIHVTCYIIMSFTFCFSKYMFVLPKCILMWKIVFVITVIKNTLLSISISYLLGLPLRNFQMFLIFCHIFDHSHYLWSLMIMILNIISFHLPFLCLLQFWLLWTPLNAKFWHFIPANLLFQNSLLSQPSLSTSLSTSMFIINIVEN